MKTQPRGFAAVSPELRRELAARGGKRAHENGTAHVFTSKEARRAGKIGGNAVSRIPGHMARIGKIGGNKVSEDTEHMKEIGRKGGSA